MPTGLSVATANGMLNGLRNAPFQVAALWVRLFTADPGATFDKSPAAEATRQQVTFSAASNGQLISSNTPTWVNITGSEIASHFVAYDDQVAGTARFSGQLLPLVEYQAGDTVSIAPGDMVVDFQIATD